MLTLNTVGSPRDRGRAHGQQAAALARAVCERYARKGALGADPAPVLRKLGAAFPELIEEMRGIAEGAGLSPDLVFRVNLQRLGAGPACSVAGLRDAAGAPWVAKTDDIGEDELGSNVLRRVLPSAGPASLQLSFAGTLWTSAGMNDRGLCMAMTGLDDGPGPEGGLPAMLLLPALVERCATVAEAVAFLSRHELDFGGISLLLADASGDLAVLEKKTRGQCARRLDRDAAFLAHTNHACLGPLADPPAFAATPLARNSRERLGRLQALVPTLPRGREGLMALLRDHDPRGGLCQHGGGGLHTDYGIVCSPSERGAWIAAGPPCRTPFNFIPRPSAGLAVQAP
jgi:isopenicillin-N N-acyltransferase-like protein